ncbi:hypothetical protein [Streptomyces sp. NPDC046759]
MAFGQLQEQLARAAAGVVRKPPRREVKPAGEASAEPDDDFGEAALPDSG